MSNAVAERPDTVQIAQEIPVEGTVTVSLAQVDDQRYPNYRKKAREAHLIDLFGKIKEHKQLTPCVGAWTKEGKVAIIAGWCRLEVLRRLALEKLVREYNTANSKESTDPGYISLGGDGFDSHKMREKIKEAGGEWAAKYEAALKGANILFRTVVVENDADAALKAIVENTYDKPPLMDLCDRIETLLAEHAGEITQKQVAKALKMSEPAVSQHRKIKSVPDHLRTLFAGDVTELVKKGEDVETKRQVLQTAISELERRLSLEQEMALPGGGTTTNPQCISFSHAREFSGAVMNSKEPMTLAGVQKALFDLVRMNDNGKLSDEPTLDYGTFMAKLKEARRLGKAEPAAEAGAAAPAAAGATAAAAPAGTPTTASANVANLSPEVAAQFDKAGDDLAKQEATATATGTPVSSGNQPAAQAQPAAPLVPVAAQQPQLSPEDKARMAEIEAANSGDKIEDLLKAEGDGTPVGGAQVSAVEGQMKGKTTDAPVPDKYKNRKTPEKVEAMANKMLDYATDERVSTAAQIGYLLASAQLFNAVGMDEAEMIVNESFVNLDDSLRKYITTLENTVKDARGEATLKEIQALLPKFTRPQLAK